MDPNGPWKWSMDALIIINAPIIQTIIFYSTVANSIAWILRILGLRYKTVRRTGHAHIGRPIQNNPKIIMKPFSKLVQENPFF